MHRGGGGRLGYGDLGLGCLANVVRRRWLQHYSDYRIGSISSRSINSRNCVFGRHNINNYCE